MFPGDGGEMLGGGQSVNEKINKERSK